MSVFLATHADRFWGPNPGHTPEGFKRLREIALMIPADIPLFVIGTGKRFREIHETITKTRPDLVPARQQSSPFCGSADGIEKNGKIILVDETLVDRDDYLGIIGTTCFNAWDFVRNLPPHTLLCAGGELLIALGLSSIREQGQLYELYPSLVDGWKIS